MTVCVKQLHGRLPVAEVVLGRALVSVVLSGWLVRRAGLDPLGQRRGLLALRGAVGTAALFCVYLGVMRLPLADATVLQYLYPTVTALLAWAWLGERPGGRIALAMALGWFGVMVMVNPLGAGDPSNSLQLEGVAWAVAGALLTAVAYVSVRELGRSEHPQVIVLWFPLISIPLSLPLVALEPTVPTLPEIGWLLGWACLPNSARSASPTAWCTCRRRKPPRSATPKWPSPPCGAGWCSMKGLGLAPWRWPG